MGLVYLAAFILSGLSAQAQNSIDILDQDLNQIKTEHQQASSELVSNFLDQLNAAADSADAAMALYQKAGGKMPDPTPVVTKYDHETPDEKAARDAQDAAKLSALSNVVQLHCGMMKYAALFVIQPDQQGLQDDWLAWLKKAAQLYPQLYAAEQAAAPPASDPADTPQDHPLSRLRGMGEVGTGQLVDRCRAGTLPQAGAGPTAQNSGPGHFGGVGHLHRHEECGPIGPGTVGQR